MTTRDWGASLQDFLNDCVEGRITDQREALFSFAGLIDDAPPEFAALFERSITKQRLGELCDVKAYANAAIEMIGPSCGFLVTRSASGSASALVTISSDVEEGNFVGDDPAIALLGACARAMQLVMAGPRLN